MGCLKQEDRITTQSKKYLQKMFESLNPAGKSMLLDFAEFLSEKYTNNQQEDGADVHADPPLPAEPLKIHRPEKESVVKAIKRLSKTYPMIEKSNMLTATSTLMTEHLMKGQEATTIIDQLEELFKSEYEKYMTESRAMFRASR